MLKERNTHSQLIKGKSIAVSSHAQVKKGSSAHWFWLCCSFIPWTHLVSISFSFGYWTQWQETEGEKESRTMILKVLEKRDNEKDFLARLQRHWVPCRSEATIWRETKPICWSSQDSTIVCKIKSTEILNRHRLRKRNGGLLLCWFMDGVQSQYFKFWEILVASFSDEFQNYKRDYDLVGSGKLKGHKN